MSSQAQRGSLVAQLLLSLLLLAGAIAVFLNRQLLFDQVMAWQYQPSPAIAAISERAEFSDRGQFLFYASQPQLLSRDAFNASCRSTASEKTAILGCYARNQIYLFDIDNKALDGIKEVTAAHEMLHAAYQRLSTSEKKHVNSLLEAQKKSLGPDAERINTLMEEYAKSEPGEELNELHSILGSEVANLDPALEAYYAQYFDDRAAVVHLADEYQSVFAELQSQQEALVAELTAVADEIDARSQKYRSASASLEQDIRNFNRQASSGSLSRDEYETKRSRLESRQAALSNEYDAIQALVSRYDSLRTKLAAINSESATLNRSINSSVTPVSEGIDG